MLTPTIAQETLEKCARLQTLNGQAIATREGDAEKAALQNEISTVVIENAATLLAGYLKVKMEFEPLLAVEAMKLRYASEHNARIYAKQHAAAEAAAKQ